MPADPRRVKDLFVAAVELADPQARQAFLERECGEDADLRRRLDVLLAAHDQPESALERPLAGGRTVDQAPADAVGEVVAGRYKLLQAIGEGGMGEVWVAEQVEPIRRRVALKVIKPGMDSRSVLGRFEAERQALALMDHPNIAKVLDAGTSEDGRPFFVMELVKGTPITAFCDARKLGPRERLELLVPVCQAVQHAHQKGIIHRDIKPSNVLVALHDETPVPKVIDFGVAKAVGQQLTERTVYTGFGALVGTPAYMAPEQATFNQLDVDTRADVYALGVLLYELLAGSPPFEPERLKKVALDEVLRLVREEEPPRPSARLSSSEAKATIAAARQSDPVRLSAMMRGELDWVVMKALEKDRNRRYESAVGLARDVERYLKGEPVEACPPTWGYRVLKFVGRNKGRVVAAVLVLAALLAGVAGTTWQMAGRRRDREVAQARARQAVESLLDQAVAAMRADRMGEVTAALAAAETGLAEVDAADLRERYEAATKDAAMVGRLNQLFEQSWAIAFSEEIVDRAASKAQSYRQAFVEYGIDPIGGDLGEALRRLRQSHASAALLAALSDWFFVEADRPVGLLALLEQADPDPYRSSVRHAFAAKDDQRLTALAEKADGRALPPGFAVALAGAVSDAPGGLDLRIMKSCWLHHPSYYPLVYQIATHLFWRVDYSQSVDWFRMAVALRPTSGTAHYNLSIALLFRKREGDAKEIELALRRAIQLGMQDAATFTQLGMALVSQGQADLAEVEFARAFKSRPGYYPATMGTIWGSSALLVKHSSPSERACSGPRLSLRARPWLAAG